MTEVHVEQGPLDAGVPLVFKEYGRRVRMLFDPQQIGEDAALTLLENHLPHLTQRTVVTRRAHAA